MCAGETYAKIGISSQASTAFTLHPYQEFERQPRFQTGIVLACLRQSAEFIRHFAQDLHQTDGKLAMQSIPVPPLNYRDQWLALLNHYGVGSPTLLQVVQVPSGLVQATVGEPSGKIALDAAPAHVLMFNISPVQRLRQVREGHSFTSDMLQGEMSLVPRGVPTEWSWNSTCDRLDVAISPDVFSDGSKLDVVDRFAFRDSEIEGICRRAYRGLSLSASSDRLYVESILMKVAVLLLLRHSTASRPCKVLPTTGLTRKQASRVLGYIEANLERELTLAELAQIVEVSLHHFARMFRRTMGMAPYCYVLERRIWSSTRESSRASYARYQFSCRLVRMASV